MFRWLKKHEMSLRFKKILTFWKSIRAPFSFSCVTEYCIICLDQKILFLNSDAVTLRDFFLISFWRVRACVC